MLKEMATAGVGMAVVVTAVWVGMVAIASGVERKQLRKQKLKDWRDNYDITYSCICSGYNYYHMVY